MHNDCFYFLTILNNAALNMGMQITLQDLIFDTFEYISSSGVALSYSMSVVNFLMTHNNLFHIVCTSLQSLSQCTRVPFSPHPCQHFLFIVFSDDSHPVKCEVIAHCGFDLHFPDN